MSKRRNNLDSLNDEMIDLMERIDSLRAALAAMPRMKINTPFHLDRVAEKHRLMIQLDRLRSEQAALLA
jgi:hypothetical protein